MRIRMKVRKIACPDGNTPTIYENGLAYEVPSAIVPKMFLESEYEGLDEEQVPPHKPRLSPEQKALLQLEARAVKAVPIEEA